MNVLSDTVHKARKRHQCQYCLLPIDPGERYHRQFIVDGGDNWTWRSHVWCQHFAHSVIRAQEDFYPDEGLDAEGFLESLYWWLHKQLGEIDADLCREGRREAYQQEWQKLNRARAS